MSEPPISPTPRSGDIPTDPPRPLEAERCGDVGPRGFNCKLRKGHAPPDLHAGGGDTWSDSNEGDGWKPPSIRDMPNAEDEEKRLVMRLVAASERQAEALEGIRVSIEHYVEMAFHRVNP